MATDKTRLGLALNMVKNRRRQYVANSREEAGIHGQKTTEFSRWWFVSETCQLISGTFGPTAAAFSICSLTEDWRKSPSPVERRSEDGGTSTLKWYRGLNYVCITSLIIVNISFFLHTGKYISWRTSNFVIVTGLLISLSIQLVLVLVVRTSASESQLQFSQAYYYAIMAAVLEFITLLSTVLAMAGAVKKYYPKQSTLGSTQIALIRQTTGLLVYMLTGAAIYMSIEGWTFLDAVYWADFTLLTIGIGGELTPKTTIGRSLLLPYAIFGIVIVALMVTSVKSLMKTGKGHMRAHWVEIRRRRLHSSVFTRKKNQYGSMAKARDSFRQSGLEQFTLMRRLKRDAEFRCKWTAFALSTIAGLGLFLVGALAFKISEKDENWTYFTGFYFAYVSLLTIGYGDYQPTSSFGRSFFVAWTLLAVPILTIFISNSADAVYGTMQIVFDRFRCITRGLGLEMSEAVPGGFQEVGPEDTVLREREQSPEFFYNYQKTFGGHNNEWRAKRRLYDYGLNWMREEECIHELDHPLLLHCSTIATELRRVMKEINSQPPKRYTYGDWMFYIRLVTPTQLHSSGANGSTSENTSRGKAPDIIWTETFPCTNQELHNCSWYCQWSPLLGQNEAEWIAAKLAQRLEEMLGTIRCSA